MPPPYSSASTQRHEAPLPTLRFTTTQTGYEPDTIPQLTHRTLRLLRVDSVRRPKATWVLEEFKVNGDDWDPKSKEDWEEVLKVFSRRYPFVALACRKEPGSAQALRLSRPVLEALQRVLARVEGEDKQCTRYIWAESLNPWPREWNSRVPVPGDVMFHHARRVVVLPEGPRRLVGLDCPDGHVEFHGSVAAQHAIKSLIASTGPVRVFVLYERSVSDAQNIPSTRASSYASSSFSSASCAASSASSAASRASSAASAATITTRDQETVLLTTGGNSIEVALTPLLPEVPSASRSATNDSRGDRLRLRLGLPGVPRGPTMTGMDRKLRDVQNRFKKVLGSATSPKGFISSLVDEFKMRSPRRLGNARAGEGSKADGERQTLVVAEFLTDFMAHVEEKYSVMMIPTNFWLGLLGAPCAAPWNILPILPECPHMSSDLSASLQRNDEKIGISFKPPPADMESPGCLDIKLSNARAWRAYRVHSPAEQKVVDEPQSPVHKLPAEGTWFARVAQMEIGSPGGGRDQWHFKFHPNTTPQPVAAEEWYWIVYVGDLELYPGASASGKRTLRVLVLKDLGPARPADDGAQGDSPLGDRIVLVESWSLLTVDEPREFDEVDVARRNFIIPVFHIPTEKEEVQQRIEEEKARQ